MIHASAITYRVHHLATSRTSQPQAGVDNAVQRIDGKNHRMRLSCLQQSGIWVHRVPLREAPVSGKRVGLLLNLGERKVEVKRKVNVLNRG